MKTPIQVMTEAFIKFGKLYQLDRPEPEYIETLHAALKAYGWTTQGFLNVLNLLLTDNSYAENAKFGKYPTINDFLRTKHRLDSKEFYDSLAAYLSGCWWEKETVLALATPQQANALLAAGGLARLYERATSDIPTPISKLVDLVAQHEETAPSEIINNTNRLGAPQSLAKIISKNENFS